MIKGNKGMVAITIVLVLAMVMSIASAGPNVKESLKQHKERLNPVEDKDELEHKVRLMPSESITFSSERLATELIYDDGSADDAWSWDYGDNGFAVRFTPLSYPVSLKTARICLYPNWPDSDHEQFAIEVYDDNGPLGDPGTKLGGPVYYTATNWGWCDVDISGQGITISSGDFYILYKQLTDYPDCEGLSTDYDAPIYERSWDYGSGGFWDLWPYDNYMIRCVVDDSPIEPKWTFMVYLDGDNNLEGAAIDDFMEMSSVGSTSDVNIVVQFDRIPGYVSSYGDWTDCKRFHVTSGMTPTPANAISDLGECNMGDSNTLSDFVDWAMTQYPAENYALILWNHGSGWKKWKWNDPDPDIGRGVCWDDTNGGDYLTLRETEQALTGKYVDLLGYDACLMHMMAVVYQVRDKAGVSVGSEEVEPGDGWPHDTILTDLTGTPTMNEYTLGEVIVDRYMASYPTYNDLTQSAMDNSALPNLGTAVDNLAQALINEINGGNWAQVQQARNAAVEMMHDSDYIDLYHFAEMVDTYVPGAGAQANVVMNEVSWSMYEAHGTSVPNDHGLSIYCPRYGGGYLASYGGTAFARDTQWNEFLMKYLYPDGAGLDDIAVFRAGKWYVDTNGDHVADRSFWYGIADDVPLVGDINQDGKDDTIIFRNGKWFVDMTGDHVADESFWYGTAGDVPLVGDINQDGTDDTIIFRNGKWFVDTDYNHVADRSFWYGIADDVPLAGDINQDGTDDTVIFRNGKWFVDTDYNHVADESFWYGIADDVPLAGDVNQDGTDDTVIFRNGKWFVDTDYNHVADESFWYGIAGDISVVGDIG